MDGKKLSVLIGIWLMIKGVLNLLLGFGIGNLISLVVAVVFAYVLYIGMPYSNYIIGALVAIVVIKNLPYNLFHLQIIYLAEAVVDAYCVFMLFVNANIKVHCSK